MGDCVLNYKDEPLWRLQKKKRNENVNEEAYVWNALSVYILCEQNVEKPKRTEPEDNEPKYEKVWFFC